MCPLILWLALLVAQSAASTTAPQSTAESPQATKQESVAASWDILKDGLEEKASDRRAKSAHALGLLENNARAEQMAEKALTDGNADVRASAATALGEMKARSSTPKLQNALKDSDLKVVIAAANSLYIFKDPAAWDIYYAVLTGERKGPGLVQSQLDTLKDKKQLEKLMFETGIGFVPFGGMGYEAFKAITRDDNSPVRAAAAEKLATDPDPKTAQALAKECSDKQWRVRVAVVEAIGKRGDPGLLSSVTPLLYDSSDEVRYEAAAAVIRLSTSSAPARAKALMKRRRG